MPGDTIEVVSSVASGQCAVTTPQLTIKGVGARPTITAADGVAGWSIAAADVTIENLAFAGSRCEDCAAIELLQGSLSLRNVSIQGSDVGLKARDFAGSALTVERCDISANRSNVEVGNIGRFAMISSYIHDAQGGGLVKTAAVENSLRSNRFASGADPSASGELVIAGSAKSEIYGNVLVRSSAASTAGLIQYLDNAAGQPGEIAAERNTLVNAAVSGIQFVEFVGERAPALRLSRNVFWGDSPADAASSAEGASSNYFGADDVFTGDEDFRLNGRFVNSDSGAVAADDSGFPLTTNPVKTMVRKASAEAIRTAAGGATPKSITLTSSLVGGSGYIFSNMVYLTGPAPSGGVTVAFTSSNTSVVTLVNTSIVIPAGASSGKFAFKSILPSTLTSVTIRATANGGSASATLRVGPVSISRVTLGGSQIGSNGSITTNRVELTGPAPAGGMVVSMSSSTSVVKPTATVTIPAGLTSNSFSLSAGVVSSPTTGVITAKHTTGTQSASISVLPVSASRLLVTPANASGGSSILVKVYLNGPAPAGGLSVALNSSNPTVLPLPPTINVPAGGTELGIIAKLAWVASNTSLTVTATTPYGKVSSLITAIPTQLAGIVPSATSVRSGGSVTFSVRLTGAAPSGGLTVTLSSSNAGAISVPSSVFIPAGAREASVTRTVGKVSASTAVTITGRGGPATRTTTVTVAP